MTQPPKSPFFHTPSRPHSGTVWHNWAGNVSAHPQKYVQPRSEDEVRQVILDAAERGLKVRVVGAGHSFTATAASDDILMNLDRLSGLQHYNRATGEVTVKAGTRLYNLNIILAGLGRAQENMGDINKQSVAGAVSTGTHGTGLTLGSVGTQIESLRLIDGLGRTHTITHEQAKELSAARLSLGALGVVTSVTLRTLPAYNLKMEIYPGHFDEMIALGLEYAQTYRHFEFYWVPYTNMVQVKRSNLTDEKAAPDGLVQRFNDVVLENMGMKLLSDINKAYPNRTQTVCNVIGAAITPNTRVQASHDIFGSERNVRFKEMEYAVPLNALPAALRDLRKLMHERRFPISFPVEVRFVQGDDVMLSTAQGRDSGYIAIHAYQGVDESEYFSEAEAVFLAHEGRPHWGKCHTLAAQDFAQLYPYFGEFKRIRNQLDPEKRFENAYLRRVLGE